jgi:hypothetical protein
MRRSIARAVILFVSLVVAALRLGAADAHPPSAADLIARNLAARGGAERWREVRTLELRGTFDAWSAPVGMTIERSRPSSFRFDHDLFGAPATLAYDGEVVWVAAAGLGVPEPARLDDAWKRNVVEDAYLVNRLQALAEAGAPMELLGRGDVDGVAAWRLRVTPADAPPEVWYLDAATGRELKRESVTFDVFSGAIEMPMETYWADFRTVDGLTIPFREERHFGTRYHLYVVKSVRVNPPIEPSRFTAPEPPPPAPPEPGKAGEAEGGDGTD